MNGTRRPACLIALIPLLLAASPELSSIPSGTAQGPPDFLKSMFNGRIREMRASDDYLVVHSVEGTIHQVTCLKEPEAVFLWRKTFRFMSSARGIHISGGRVAVVAAEGDAAKTVGMHIYEAETGTEVGFIRNNIFAPVGSRIVSSSGASGEVIDLASASKVFEYSRAHRIRLKAVIGDKALYLLGEGADSQPLIPLLLSLPDLGESWRDKSFPPGVLDFLHREMDPEEKHIRDGFPTLFAGKPKTNPAGPFPLLLLDADGRARLMTPADFDIAEPDRSLVVEFCRAWTSGSARGLVAGLDTGRLRAQGARELILVSLDPAGNRLGQTSLSLSDHRLLWSGISSQGHLLLLLHRTRPKSAYLFVSYRIPDLVKLHEKELGFLRGSPGPARLIDGEVFISGSTARNEETIFSLMGADGALNAFYPFPERPYFLQTAPDDIFGVFNSRNLFVAMNTRQDPPHTMVHRIPRRTAGWFTESTLSVPSPVYTNASVTVAYAPEYATLSAGGGSLSGAVWTAPSVPGTYTIALSAGSARRECEVQVVEPPPNAPPVADFRLIDPAESVMWEGPARFDASASHDPDGRIIKYAWDFGDSIKDEGEDKIQASHIAAAGVYDVTLTVTDDKGATGTKTRTIVLGRTLSYRQPWHPSIGVPPALASGTAADYRIEILTGGQDGAGTNASVYLALYGPKNADGMRFGSGEFRLDAAASVIYDNPFEQNLIDGFGVRPAGLAGGIRPGRNLDDAEFLTLRHDNTGDRPGWFCYGVRVTNEKNGKSWVFVPDQWLAFDEGPAARTWYKFLPVEEAYPGGIYFGGSGEPRCEGLIKAADNVFILPASMTGFYFTMLERGRYIGVFRDGALVGGTSVSGSSPLHPKFLRKSEWGIMCQASSITRPTKFDVTLGSGGDAKKGIVWIFPSSWADHSDLARKAVLVLPLKSNLGVFDYGTTAKSFLQGRTVDVAAALAPIVGYGAEALAIFGDLPDLTLEGYVEDAVSQYVDLRLTLIAARLGVGFAADLTSSIGALLTSIQKALEWSSKMGGVIRSGQAAVFASPLLQNMATGKVGTVGGSRRTSGNGSFLVAVDMLQVLKGKMEALVSAAESNNPDGFRSALMDVEAILLGSTAGMTPQQIQSTPDPASFYITYSDYGISHFDSQITRGFPLLLELAFQLRMIEKIWKPKESYAPYFYSVGAIYDLEANLTTQQKKDATAAAMETYAPIIEDMMKIAGLAACIVLMN